MGQFRTEWEDQKVEGMSDEVPQLTLRRAVDDQADLLAKLDEAINGLAVHLEPIMREDPRSQFEPQVKKAGQAMLLELIEANNWRIEKVIGDLKTMQRVSAL